MNTSPLLRRRQWISAACLTAIVAAISLAGCGQAKKKLPPLDPVHGKVQYKDGRTVTDGLVCFQSESNALVTATGAIQPDGTFTLSSFIDSERKPGAVAGLHRVQISPPFTDGSPPFSSTMLKNLLEVKPGDNEFTLTVDVTK